MPFQREEHTECLPPRHSGSAVALPKLDRAPMLRSWAVHESAKPDHYAEPCRISAWRGAELFVHQSFQMRSELPHANSQEWAKSGESTLSGDHRSCGQEGQRTASGNALEH